MTLVNRAATGVQDEQTARSLLRQAGIRALQKQAGHVPECSEAAPIVFDWQPIIKPLYWEWMPSDAMATSYMIGLEILEETYGYKNGDTWFQYSIWKLFNGKAILRAVFEGRECRYQEYIDMKHISLVCLWLAYNEAYKIPF